jgi:hypothetical protein
MILIRVQKNLGLVLQTPKRLRVQDTVTVSLKGGTDGVRLFRT